MKILISTVGSHGDVLPFIAIGREMKARGHDVVFYANPHFRDHVASIGTRFVPIGNVAEYERLFGEFDDSSP